MWKVKLAWRNFPSGTSTLGHVTADLTNFVDWVPIALHRIIQIWWTQVLPAMCYVGIRLEITSVNPQVTGAAQDPTRIQLKQPPVPETGVWTVT